MQPSGTRTSGVHDFATRVCRGYFPYEIMRVEREEAFLGEVETRSTRLVSISRASANSSFSGRTLAGARPSVLVLHWAISGDIEFRQGDHAIHIAHGDMVLLDGDKPMHSEQHGAAHALALALPTHLIQARHPDYERWCLAPRHGGRGAAGILCSMLEGLWAQADSFEDDQDQELAVLGCVVDLFAATFQGGHDSASLGGLARQYERISAYIDANLRNPDLDVGTAARQLGISRSYLHAAMSAAGSTFGRRLLARRLEASAAILDKAVVKPNIAQLAQSLGFRSTSHFSRSFSEHFGTAPSAYRFRRQRELARLIH